MYHIYNDLPITEAAKDVFDRKKIVDAIVETIYNKTNTNHPCFTIGLYAKWGEGKTSVINLIEEKIKSHKKVVISKFNPWFFKDQESLLLDFFTSINGEKISKVFVNNLKKYGPIASMGISGVINLFAPGLGNIAKECSLDFFDKLPDLQNNPIKRKEELNKDIKKSKKHLVIFIDDVDRLDKNEIHTLFKLIKQTANFDNTIFIIAMDKEIVAKSLASEFENGDIQSGYNFLSKIIQLQLYLPKIQQGQLLRFLEEKINEIFPPLAQLTDLKKQEYIEAKKNIYQYVLPLVNTARDIIQYTNILSYSIPLIADEVNISDLCLLEFLKVFYPYGYRIIYNSRHVILGENHDMEYYVKVLNDDAKKKELTEQEKQNFIQLILKEAPSYQVFFIKNLLQEILCNYIYGENSNQLEINSKKHLCSRNFYDKYFMYGTPEYLISENLTSQIVECIKEKDDTELSHYFNQLLKSYNPNELERVVFQIVYNHHTNGITNKEIGKLCISLALLEENSTRLHYTEFNGRKQWEMTITDILNSYVNIWVEDNLIKDFSTILETISVISKKSLVPFNLFFAVELKKRGFAGYENVDRVNNMVYESIKRFIEERSADALFSLGQVCIIELFTVWKEVKYSEYRDFVSTHIADDNFDIVTLINTLIYNQDKKYYVPFTELFDKEEVYQRLEKEVVKNPRLRRKEKEVNLFMQLYEEEATQILY